MSFDDARNYDEKKASNSVQDDDDEQDETERRFRERVFFLFLFRAGTK